MKSYIIITQEGKTEAPNILFKVKNMQVMGIIKNVANEDEALKKLLINNDWIIDAQFNVAEFELFEIL
jgi:hypothetical protein